METDRILICRLCFEICKSGFEVIEDSTKETLNFLLLNLDLEISDEPVICDSCVGSLKECLNFKTDHLRKSDSVAIKHESVDLNVPEIHFTESELDTHDMVCDNCVGGLKECLCSKTGCLRKSESMTIKREGISLNVPEIHLPENAVDIPGTFSTGDVCCSCKERINRNSSVLLMNEEKSVTAILEKYYPELNLNGTTDSICVACYKSLQNQMTFISKCLAVEEKVKNYCKVEGTNSKGQVELGNVLRFVSKNQLQNNIYSSFSTFTVENTCEETEDEYKTKVENKDFVVKEEPGIYSIENEDIDIKMEQDDEDREAATVASLNLLPEKSRKVYNMAYESFLNWQKEKKTTSFSESTLLVYFTELSTKYKSTTLWTYYSMLRSMITLHQGINLEDYQKLRALLKRKSEGFQPKKTKTFSSEDINNFLTKASDNKYLATKVALIMGVIGACRSNELYEMKITHLQDLGSAFLVNVPNTKTKIYRKFTITDNFYKICKTYISLRPSHVTIDTFFLNYKYGKCTTQRIGKNKFTKMGKDIAAFLKLPNPEQYSGHSFRRSSTTILVDAGGDITALKRHGGWKPTTVAGGYIVKSVKVKTDTSNKISSIQPKVNQTNQYKSNISSYQNISFDVNSIPSINLTNCSNITIINNYK